MYVRSVDNAYCELEGTNHRLGVREDEVVVRLW
jgi:hypothetical protein